MTENLQGIPLARDVALAIRSKIKEVTDLLGCESVRPRGEMPVDRRIQLSRKTGIRIAQKIRIYDHARQCVDLVGRKRLEGQLRKAAQTVEAWLAPLAKIEILARQLPHSEPLFGIRRALPLLSCSSPRWFERPTLVQAVVTRRTACSARSAWKRFCCRSHGKLAGIDKTPRSAFEAGPASGDLVIGAAGR